MLLITYHTWYTWKKIMFKTVSVFHKLTLKLPYNPIIFKNRIFFTISDFVDIILIFFRIQRTIWWWNFFGSPINFLHFRKNAWNCTIFKTQYLIKYSKYTKKISPLYLFFQSENNEYNIVQIRKIYSIAVFMTLQSLPTHLLKNWDGFEHDFFPYISCMIGDQQHIFKSAQ